MCGDISRYFVVVVLIFDAIIPGEGQTSCNCVPLKKCTSMMTLTVNLEEPLKSTFFEFLRSKQCGFENGRPKVCCPGSPKEHQTEPTQGRSCKTGSACVILKNCEPYMHLIKSSRKPLTGPVIHFLRSQECGFQDDMPRVCCSPVPINIKALKHARPESRRPLNRLSVDLVEDVTTTTTTTKRSVQTIPTKQITKRKPSKTFIEFRDEFFSGFFDYTEGFDILSRKKRFDIESFLDVEIR